MVAAVERSSAAVERSSAAIVVVLAALAALAGGARRVAADPGQVHLSLTADDSEMVVFWMSRRKTKTSTVQYGTDREGLDRTATAGRREPFTYGTPDGRYASDWIHEVKLEGLWRGTRYFYRCGDPERGWSPVYSFRTRRHHDAPIRFPILSDQGTFHSRYNADRVVPVVFSKLSMYDFWLHAGDMCYADGDQPDWDRYGEEMEQYTANLPGAYAVGNHERDDDVMEFDAFLARWRNGETGEGDDRFFYSFNYGPVHLIIASSEHRDDDDTQTKWLEQDLIEASKPENRLFRPWVILVMHRPMFADGRKRLKKTADRKGIIKLIEKYNVDIYMTGHCHDYERNRPYKFDSKEVTTKSKGQGQDPYISYAYEPEKLGSLGTIQLLVGTAGHGTGTPCRRQDGLTIDDVLKIYGFGVVEADRSKLVFQMVEHTGRVRDEFKICARERCAPAPSLGPPTPSPPPPKVWWVKPTSAPAAGAGEEAALLEAAPGVALAQEEAAYSTEHDWMSVGFEDGFDDNLFNHFEDTGMYSNNVSRAVVSEAIQGPESKAVTLPPLVWVAVCAAVTAVVVGAVIMAAFGWIAYTERTRSPPVPPAEGQAEVMQ